MEPFAWTMHKDPKRGVEDPYSYYGKEKMDNFVKQILLKEEKQSVKNESVLELEKERQKKLHAVKCK